MTDNNTGEGLYLYLKSKTLYSSRICVGVNIKSKTFIESKNTLEESELKNCIITEINDKEDKKEFQLAYSVYAVLIEFSEVEKWERNKKQPDKIIDLYLKKSLIFEEEDIQGKYKKMRLEPM